MEAQPRSQTRSFVGMQTRLEKVIDVAIAREVEQLEKRSWLLATVGSAGPFIGLFGTVWGIMTTFSRSPPPRIDCACNNVTSETWNANRR